MNKLLLLALALGLITPELRAQANIANTLYASNFAQWSVPQGNNGPFSWSSPQVCTAASSGGVQFKPFVVGMPIRIMDSATPGNSENVTVTAVSIIGSGCSITTSTPAHQHYSFYLTSATAGLQEAINYSNQQIRTAAPASVVVLTPAWTIAGGTTGMITSAAGSTAVSILDQRSSVIVPYTWQSTLYVAQPFGPVLGFAVLLNPSAEQDITGHNLALGGGGFYGLGLTGSNITHAFDGLVSNSSMDVTALNQAEVRVGNSSEIVGSYEGFAAGAYNLSALEVTMGKLAFVNTALTAGAETAIPHIVTRVAGTLTDQGVPCTSNGYGGVGCVSVNLSAALAASPYSLNHTTCPNGLLTNSATTDGVFGCGDHAFSKILNLTPNAASSLYYTGGADVAQAINAAAAVSTNGQVDATGFGSGTYTTTHTLALPVGTIVKVSPGFIIKCGLMVNGGNSGGLPCITLGEGAGFEYGQRNSGLGSVVLDTTFNGTVSNAPIGSTKLAITSWSVTSNVLTVVTTGYMAGNLPGGLVGQNITLWGMTTAYLQGFSGNVTGVSGHNFTMAITRPNASNTESGYAWETPAPIVQALHTDGTQESFAIYGMTIQGNPANTNPVGPNLLIMGNFIGTVFYNFQTNLCNSDCVLIQPGTTTHGSSDISFINSNIQDTSSVDHPGCVVRVDAKNQTAAGAGVSNITFEAGAFQYPGAHSPLLCIDSNNLGGSYGFRVIGSADYEIGATTPTTGTNWKDVTPIQITDFPNVHIGNLYWSGAMSAVSGAPSSIIEIMQSAGGGGTTLADVEIDSLRYPNTSNGWAAISAGIATDPIYGIAPVPSPEGCCWLIINNYHPNFQGTHFTDNYALIPNYGDPTVAMQGLFSYNRSVNRPSWYDGSAWQRAADLNDIVNPVVASPQFQIPYYSASGTTQTLTGDPNFTDDGTGHVTQIGPAGVNSFTGTTALGLRSNGATDTNDYSGMDFGEVSNFPQARIAAVMTGEGSHLKLGTSNNYGSGITNTAIDIDQNGNATFIGTTTLMTPALGTPASGVLTNTTGLPAASVVAGALANGMSATTQAANDNSTKLSTTAYVTNAVSNSITISNAYWSIQPTLFATATLLGPVYYTSYTNGSTNPKLTIRLSGTISCIAAPNVVLMDLGTSATTVYGSATAIASVATGTSDGVYTGIGTIALISGHYYGVAFSSGTCATAPTIDITDFDTW
jgi:hypothetical protein